MYKAYKKGMSYFPPTKVEALKDELKELLEDKNVEEFFDVVHTICRVARMPNILAYVLAYPTAKKHALRMLQYGCPRSLRNHEAAGALCICKK